MKLTLLYKKNIKASGSKEEQQATLTNFINYGVECIKEQRKDELLELYSEVYGKDEQLSEEDKINTITPIILNYSAIINSEEPQEDEIKTYSAVFDFIIDYIEQKANVKTTGELFARMRELASQVEEQQNKKRLYLTVNSNSANYLELNSLTNGLIIKDSGTLSIPLDTGEVINIFGEVFINNKTNFSLIMALSIIIKECFFKNGTTSFNTKQLIKLYKTRGKVKDNLSEDNLFIKESGIKPTKSEYLEFNRAMWLLTYVGVGVSKDGAELSETLFKIANDSKKIYTDETNVNYEIKGAKHLFFKITEHLLINDSRKIELSNIKAIKGNSKLKDIKLRDSLEVYINQIMNGDKLPFISIDDLFISYGKTSNTDGKRALVNKSIEMLEQIAKEKGYNFKVDKFNYGKSSAIKGIKIVKK